MIGSEKGSVNFNLEWELKVDYEEYNVDFLQLKYMYFAASLSVVCYKDGTHRKFRGKFRHFLIITNM